MQQSTLEQPSLYCCTFCNFLASAERSMQDHLLYHSTKSAHQCQHCNFSISTVPELDHHIQQHHLIKDQSHLKMENRPSGGKKIRVRLAIFKCGLCEFVSKYKQDLQRHEILHKEKSRYQCRLCSYSVGTRFHLTRHEKDHHSANQNTPAHVEEISVEPITVSSEEQARAEPLTVPAQEILQQEARAESPTLPPPEEVQLESVTQNKWRVESIKKGRDGSGLAPKPTRVVKASKLARFHQAQRFITAFKSFPRRKQHELLISEAKAAMKTKKPKPKEKDVALAVPMAVPAVLNPFPNAQEIDTPKAQEMDAAAAPEYAENTKEESSRVDMKREKAGSRKTENYFCGDCEFSTLQWDWMKIHRVRHEKEEEFKCTRCNFSARSKHHVSLHSDNYHRNPPRAPLEVNKIKKESPVVSESDIAAAPDRLKNSEKEPVESTRAKRMQPKPRKKLKEVFECSDCEYSTPRRDAMEKHEEMHNRKEEFKCDRCSFSASMKNHVSCHSNRYHRKPPATPPEVREVKKEQQFKEDPAVDER